MRPNWENECVSKSALIEWLRPYLHTGDPIPADVLISDIQMMPPTLTPPTPAPPCYQPDGDGCGYQCYDGDDEPIDKCKECPLCYSDKQRHHTPPNEPEYREYTCPNCHHTWLEDRDATDYPEYCPGCGEPLNRRAAEGEEGDANRG